MRRTAAALVVLMGCREHPAAVAASDCVSKSAPVASGFFPPGTWAQQQPFMTDWYGKHLSAMGEPSLWAAAEHCETAYRFLWLRTFDKPIAVRLTFDGKKAHMTATRLSGSGGYAPGSVEEHRDHDVPVDAWNRVEAALTAARFDSMGTDKSVGVDGAQWVVERAKGGSYRLVERWSPKTSGDDAAFRAACEQFLDVAGRDLVVGNVY